MTINDLKKSSFPNKVFINNLFSYKKKKIINTLNNSILYSRYRYKLFLTKLYYKNMQWLISKIFISYDVYET